MHNKVLHSAKESLIALQICFALEVTQHRECRDDFVSVGYCHSCNPIRGGPYSGCLIFDLGR